MKQWSLLFRKQIYCSLKAQWWMSPMPVPEGTSSRKALGVMPVVCKSPKRNNWVGTTFIIKVDDNPPIYLHLTYFFY